jgi:hypothetical protein
MDLLLSLFPLVLAIAIFGGIVKLAARVLKRTQVSWIQGVHLGIILLVIAVIKRFSGLDALISLPPALALALSVVVSLGIGAWFLSTRAVTSNGDLIGLRGGLKLAGLSMAIVSGLGALTVVLVPMFVR